MTHERAAPGVTRDLTCGALLNPSQALVWKEGAPMEVGTPAKQVGDLPQEPPPHLSSFLLGLPIQK